jgi:hypothetical protein
VLFLRTHKSGCCFSTFAVLGHSLIGRKHLVILFLDDKAQVWYDIWHIAFL